MPPRRRLHLVRRQVEPSGAELAFGTILLLLFAAGAAVMAGWLLGIVLEHLLLRCPACWLR